MTSLRAFIVAALLSSTFFGLAQDETINLKLVRLASNYHNSYWDTIIPAFEEANPGITIETIPVIEGAYEGLAQGVLLNVAAGDAPDLGQSGYSYIRTLIEQGGAVPINQYMEADANFSMDGMFPAMMDLGRIGETYYATPVAVSTPVLYVNKELAESAGIDMDNLPTTWEEARAAAEKCVDAGYQGITWDWTITGNWILQAMIENAGGQFGYETEDGYEITIDEEAGLRAFTYLAELAEAGLMPTTEEIPATFISGDLCFNVDTTSRYRFVVEDVNDFTIVLAPMPTLDGSTPKVPAGGNGLIMFTQDPVRQAAAWKFMNFVMQEFANDVIASNTGYTVANIAVADNQRETFSDDPNYAIILDQAPNVIAWHSWPGRNSTRIAEILKDAQQAVILGRQTPEQALQNSVRQITRLIRR